MSDLQEVSKLRRAMMPLFKMLPDTLIEANERRFTLLEKKLEALALQKSEVNVTVPDVIVPEIIMPEITVPTANVTVEINVDTIAKAIQKSQAAAPSAFEPHDQAKSSVYQYSGFLRSDGEWYIQRVAKGEQRYAKGSGSYADAWEKRSKQKYGYLG